MPHDSAAFLVVLDADSTLIRNEVIELLAEAGIDVRASARSYRPSVTFQGVSTKILKPRNIVEMLDIGARDLGFAGADWVAELEADVVELVDTELDPVRIVAAAPANRLLNEGTLPHTPLVIASEYERLTRTWIAERSLQATFLRSYGATEVFPPDDADCIVDNTQTGATLRANGLVIVANYWQDWIEFVVMWTAAV